jgi:hypothetical protein
VLQAPRRAVFFGSLFDHVCVFAIARHCFIARM